MQLHPLEDRIVVRPNGAEATTASGLVIPDTAKEKPQQGEVLAAGPGRRAELNGELIPTGVKAGDTVVFSKYGCNVSLVDFLICDYICCFIVLRIDTQRIVYDSCKTITFGSYAVYERLLFVASTRRTVCCENHGATDYRRPPSRLLWIGCWCSLGGQWRLR